MVVTIAGCGALGCLLGARLIEAGITVQAYQRAGAHQEALRRDGITLELEGTTRVYRLARVTHRAADLQPAKLLIVLVKAYQTSELTAARDLLAPDGAALTLQNGLGNAEILANLVGENRLAAGITTYGAHRVAPGVIRWGGDGYILSGPWAPDVDLSWTVELLNRANLNATYVADPREPLWKKLAINAMVNPLAALTRQRNGDLRKDAGLLALMEQICRETLTAAERAGVRLDFERLWSMHLENLERTAANRPSMLQDVEAGRRTEIEAISGSILRCARSESEFPYTRCLYWLLEAMNQ